MVAYSTSMRAPGPVGRAVIRTEILAGVTTFLTMIGIPLSYSIADGLALGFVSYPLLTLLSGRGRSVGFVSYLMAALLAAYVVLIRARLG
jgi:AGZA family xanthine/uracil permease-like MFS transporter